MHVRIDHRAVEMAVGDGHRFSDLIEQVRAEAAERKRVLANVTVEGRALTGGQLDEWLGKPCGQIKQVEFETACPRALARETIGAVSALFAENTQLQQEASEKLAAGQTGKAMEQLAGCLGLYKAAQEAVSQAVQLNRLNLGELTVGGQAMTQAVSGLTEKLSEVKSALETRDLVLLGDLLTYEFPRITEQWQAILSELDKHLAD